MKKSKSVCVIGLGYIGLPTAAILANVGWNVTGVDVNQDLVNNINKGLVSFNEKGLKEILKEVVDEGYLQASITPSYADYFIISVPTPITDEKKADLSYVIEAINTIIPFLRINNTIIIESTIPPKTIDNFIVPLINATGFSPGIDIFIAHCPERVLPGNLLEELINNTRIIGGINQESTQRAVEIYKSFVKSDIIETNALNAEMSKLMENAYRDVNIAFANELVKISETLSIDALEVIKLANLHPRVNILAPGPGVGGHCIAVDPYFIIEKAPKQTALIAAAREVNNSMPEFVIEQIKKMLPLQSEKISILGLSYKGNVGDIRESPAVSILEKLMKLGYKISVYDPHVSTSKYHLVDFVSCLLDSSLLLVLVDHNEFKFLDEEQILEYMKDPLVFDTKNIITIKNEAIRLINFSNLKDINKANKVSW